MRNNHVMRKDATTATTKLVGDSSRGSQASRDGRASARPLPSVLEHWDGAQESLRFFCQRTGLDEFQAMLEPRGK